MAAAPKFEKLDEVLKHRDGLPIDMVIACQKTPNDITEYRIGCHRSIICPALYVVQTAMESNMSEKESGVFTISPEFDRSDYTAAFIEGLYCHSRCLPYVTFHKSGRREDFSKIATLPQFRLYEYRLAHMYGTKMSNVYERAAFCLERYVQSANVWPILLAALQFNDIRMIEYCKARITKSSYEQAILMKTKLVL